MWLFLDGLVDIVAGEAEGNSGVDVTLHVVALETEFVQFGTQQVEIGIVNIAKLLWLTVHM